MFSAFINSVIVDVLVSVLIKEKGKDGIENAKQRISRHLRLARSSDKQAGLVEALEEVLECDIEEPRLFARFAVSNISDDPLVDAYWDIFDLWSLLLNKDFEKLKAWNRPWLVNAMNAEKFKGGKRSVYHGRRNQLIANSAIADTDFSSIFATRSQYDDFIGRSSKPDQVVPQIANLVSPLPWIDAAQNEKTDFISFPVWPIEIFTELMTPRELSLLDKMLDRRVNEIDAYTPLDSSLESLITEKVKWQMASHNVTVKRHHRKASYSPKADTISMPHRHQFTSAVRFYSTWLHELAHSTKGFLERDTSYCSRSDEQLYSIEEVIAETSALLGVKRLQAEAQSLGIDDSEIDACFDDAIEQSEEYMSLWASRIGDAFDVLVECQYKNQLFKSMIKDVFSCHLALSTGTNLGSEIMRT